tara:strand:+ start:376 stop:645 length:270 start_codon:yes stop_codon:yes gene_type:complete
MSVKNNDTAKIVKKISGDSKNTGAPESQIAIFSERITKLTEHMKKNKKDFSTQRGLLNLVAQRRRLMKYLKRRSVNEYEKVVKEYKIRK